MIYGVRFSTCYKQLFTSCRETCLEVCEDVVDILDTDREANRVLLNALICELSLIQLRVGRGRRVNHQALRIRDVASREKIFRLSMKAKASFCPPLMLKVKIEAPPFGKYF